MPYYNTIPLPANSADLGIRRAKTNTQEQRVLIWFTEHPGAWTPCQVWELCFQKEPNVPLTSIRRAISDLTKQGHLVKTGTLKPGIYGEMNNTWTTRKKETEYDEQNNQK